MSQGAEQSQEIPEQAAKAPLLPKLDEGNALQVKEKAVEVVHDAEKVLVNVDRLLENYPNLREILPKNFSDDLAGLRLVVDYAATRLEAMSSTELMSFLEDYNYYAEMVNTAISRGQARLKEADEQALVRDLDPSRYADMETLFTPEERAEARAYASELYRTLFPPSYTEQFLRWSKSLYLGVSPDDMQMTPTIKMLIAPAVGIESTVMGLVSFLNPQTYSDLSTAIQTAYGMSYEEWCDIMRMVQFSMEDMEAGDYMAPVISTLTGCIFFMGGLAQLGKLAPAAKMPATLEKTLSKLPAGTAIANLQTGLSIGNTIGGGVRNGIVYGKALPVGVIGGCVFKYIRV